MWSREKNGQNQGPFISSCYPDSGYGAVLQAPIYVETDVNRLMIYFITKYYRFSKLDCILLSIKQKYDKRLFLWFTHFLGYFLHKLFEIK